MRKFWKREGYSARWNRAVQEADVGGAMRRGMEQADRVMKAFERGRMYERKQWEAAVRLGAGAARDFTRQMEELRRMPGTGEEDLARVKGRVLDMSQGLDAVRNSGLTAEEADRSLRAWAGGGASAASLDRQRCPECGCTDHKSFGPCSSTGCSCSGLPFGVLSEEAEAGSLDGPCRLPLMCYHPDQTARWRVSLDPARPGASFSIHERRCPDCAAETAACGREAAPLPPWMVPGQ